MRDDESQARTERQLLYELASSFTVEERAVIEALGSKLRRRHHRHLSVLLRDCLVWVASGLYFTTPVVCPELLQTWEEWPA